MDFEYKQRPATREYRENWDRIFSHPAPDAAPAKHGPEAPGKETRSGSPAFDIRFDLRRGWTRAAAFFGALASVFILAANWCINRSIRLAQ